MAQSLIQRLRLQSPSKAHRTVGKVTRLFTTRAAAFDAEVSKINVYTAYTVYKGRGAMSLKLIKPTWERISTGSGIRVSREGTVLLEFAQSKGERVYDWDNKGTFAMNAVECGDILEAIETSTERSFFHDPNRMGSAQGAVTKTLKFSPARDSGYFFSLYVNDKSVGGVVTSRYDTAVSTAELRVIQQVLQVCLYRLIDDEIPSSASPCMSMLQFAIPRILGFDEMFAGAPEVKDSTFIATDYDPPPPPPPF